MLRRGERAREGIFISEIGLAFNQEELPMSEGRSMLAHYLDAFIPSK